jgi:hypothetical protein
MESIKVEQAGKYAHKATFTDAYGNVRTVFSLNGEMAVLQAAKNRINESKLFTKNFVKVSDFKKFVNRLFSRRSKNKQAKQNRKNNR